MQAVRTALASRSTLRTKPTAPLPPGVLPTHHDRTWDCCMADAAPPDDSHSAPPAPPPPQRDGAPRPWRQIGMATAGDAQRTTVSLCLCDTGSNCTATNDPCALHDHREFSEPRHLGLASNATATAVGEGSCTFEFLTSLGTWVAVTLKTLLVPKFRRPIVSACKLRTVTGWKFTEDGDFAIETNTGPAVLPIHDRNDQRWLIVRTRCSTLGLASPPLDATFSTGDAAWDRLSPAMQQVITSGRICAPRLGKRKVANVCQCDAADAHSMVTSAERRIDAATEADAQRLTTALPPPRAPPPPPPPPRRRVTKTQPVPTTRTAPHDGRVEKTWPVSATERARIDALSADELTRQLGLPPDDSTRNTRRHMRLRLAKLGVCGHTGADHDLLLAWHHRLCHPSLRATANFLRAQNKTGRINLDAVQKLFCETCMKVKSQRQNFKASRDRTPRNEQDQLTHFVSDAIGPLPISRKGFKYCLFFLSSHDVAYHYFAADLQAPTFERIQRQFVDDVRRDLSDMPGTVDVDLHFSPKQNVTLQSDNAPYYVSANATRVWRELGVRSQTSIPFLSESNGKAEQLVKNVRRRAACALTAAGLSSRSELWPEAFSFAIASHQILPNAANGNISPHECRTGSPPDLNTIHPPFCTVYVWRPVTGRADKQTPGRKGIYLGRDRLTDTYSVLLEDENRASTVKSHHCRFDTSLPPLAKNRWFVGKEDSRFQPRVAIHEDDDDVIDIDAINAGAQSTPIAASASGAPAAADTPDTPVAADASDTINIDELGEAASIDAAPETEFDPCNLNVVTTGLTDDDHEFMRNLLDKGSTDGMHCCYGNALRDPKWGDQVEAATNKELLGLKSSGCLVQVPSASILPTDEINRVVPIFMPKFSTDKDRTFIKYKTRICFQGKHFCKDPTDPDYIPTFTSQPRPETWRMHLAVVPTQTDANGTRVKTDTTDWVHAKADVAQAYLSVDFATPTGRPVYVKLPADLTRQAVKINMATADPGGVHWTVKRAAYGIPSAARLFEQALTVHITNTMRCTQSDYEPNMFRRDSVRFLVHSDDCHFIGRKDHVDQLIDELEVR